MGMAPDGKINVLDQFISDPDKPLGITPHLSSKWNVVISNQKYDPHSSDSAMLAEGVDAQPAKSNSTMKSCGR